MAVSKLDLEGCKMKFIYDITVGWDSVLFLGAILWVGRSSVWIPAGARGCYFLLTFDQTGSGAYPISSWMATRDSFLGVKQLGMMFNTDLHLGLSLRMSASVPPLTQYVFIAWTGTTLPLHIKLPLPLWCSYISQIIVHFILITARSLGVFHFRSGLMTSEMWQVISEFRQLAYFLHQNVC